MVCIWRRTGGARCPWVAVETADTVEEAFAMLPRMHAYGEYRVSAKRPKADAEVHRRVKPPPPPKTANGRLFSTPKFDH